MNQVNITGMIANVPVFREEAGGTPHTILSLRLRHKTRAGELRKETYRVSAWYGIAVWARDNVAAGQIVTVHGYLTQRKTRDGAIATEICAEEIVPSVQTKYKPDRAITGNADSVNADRSVPAQVNPSVAADIAPAADATCTADATESDSGCAPDHSDASETPATLDDADTPAA